LKNTQTDKQKDSPLKTLLQRRPGPHKKWPPLGGTVARIFPNVSLAMCPLKLSLAPDLLDSGAGTALLTRLPSAWVMQCVRSAEQLRIEVDRRLFD